MNLSDEIQKLQELHDAGALTDEEFARAKSVVLASALPDAAAIGSTPVLEDIRHQNEVARLDREWELEREQYMVTGRYGSRHLPSEGGSILGAVLLGGFGIFWTITAASGGAPVFFVLFGVVFIAMAVGMGISGATKAAGYREARKKYQQRRARLLAQSKQ